MNCVIKCRLIEKYFCSVKLSHMSAIFILIGVSLFVAVGFLIAFIQAVKGGQFEDDYTPSVRMLFDNETKQGFEKPRIKELNFKEKTSSNL